MKMTVSKAIERRLRLGDIRVDRDGGGIYLPYDNIAVSLYHNVVEFELRQRAVILGSVSSPAKELLAGRQIIYMDVEGRMRIDEQRRFGGFNFYDRDLKP